MARCFTVHGLLPRAETRLLLGVLHFKELPFTFRPLRLAEREAMGARLGREPEAVLETPEGWLLDGVSAVVEWLERSERAHPLLPATPLQRSVCRVLLDWAEQWLVRPATHFRFTIDEDAERRGRDLAEELLGGDEAVVGGAASAGGAAEAATATLAARLIALGLAEARRLGAVAETRSAQELFYARLLELLEAHLRIHPFLLGARPCLADFAFEAIFASHFAVDPTPGAILARRAPSVGDWLARVSEVRGSGCGDWMPGDTVPIHLLPLLEEVGREYHPFLLANAAALAAGRSRCRVELDFEWRELPVRPECEARREKRRDQLAPLRSRERADLLAVFAPLGLARAYGLATPASGGAARAVAASSRLL